MTSTTRRAPAHGWVVAACIAAMAGGVFVGCKETAAPATAADASSGADASTAVLVDADANANAAASADAGVSADASGDANANATVGAGTADAADAGGHGGRVVRLEQDAEGKTVDVPADCKIVLLLVASPTSGFDWSVTKAPAALGTPEMGFVAPSGDAMGAAGKRRIVWTLKGALPAGESAVELAYRRGFEQGTAPAKTFRFKVRPAH